jgi:hypothetical protein
MDFKTHHMYKVIYALIFIGMILISHHFGYLWLIKEKWHDYDYQDMSLKRVETVLMIMQSGIPLNGTPTADVSTILYILHYSNKEENTRVDKLEYNFKNALRRMLIEYFLDYSKKNPNEDYEKVLRPVLNLGNQEADIGLWKFSSKVLKGNYTSDDVADLISRLRNIGAIYTMDALVERTTFGILQQKVNTNTTLEFITNAMTIWKK